MPTNARARPPRPPRPRRRPEAAANRASVGVVDDENLDLDLKHMKAHTPGTPAPDHDPKLPVDDVELQTDDPKVQAAHNALQQSEWPAWEFGW